MKTYLSHISRTLLGLVFLFSGAVKAIDPLGTVYKIEDYLKAFGGFFTDLLPLATVAAFCLILTELLLGVALTLNIRPEWGKWLTLAFYLVMTPLTLYIALTNPVSDCGCFGDAIVLTNWQTFWKNIVLISLAVIWLCTAQTTPSGWKPIAEASIAFVVIMIVVGFMVWTLHHLPLIDFRPYKVGNNIPALMEYPDDAESDEYAITFVYEKDGKRQTFTLENYPKGDSTWTFVSQNSTLIKKGYEPPIHDFELINADYDDITYDILESTEPVKLVIMYDLNKAAAERLDKETKPYYIVTGSGTDDIIAFCLQHPQVQEEDFLTCDPVTLKTIVRANPGVIIVQNGTIISKYSL